MSKPLISTPFGASSTAAEVIAGVDLTGRRAIVTGGASGIGVETARALVSAGAEVTLAVRNVAAGQKVGAELGAGVTVSPLDVADQSSVRDFVAGWSGPLHILVNNAGIMALPELERSAEGWELQFATNHLGHFALAVGLHGALALAGAEAGGARIVSVSSVGHVNGAVDVDDLQFDRRPYDPWVAYGQSKTANILFAVEAAKRWAGKGITANALNPGRIPSTGLMRHLDAVAPAAAPAPGVASSTGVSVKNVEQGAATSVLLAASPLLDNVSGRYFEDGQEAAGRQDGIRRGVAAYALDPVNAARLWEISLGLIGAAS
jgi:NAD(P)-dependent dehydrogenase (short-subunit alcohol dehydrogenase family)